MSKNFKKIRALKPGSVFLVEDKNGQPFVLKKGPAKRLENLAKLVQQEGGDLAQVMPTFVAEDGFICLKYLDWQLAGDTVRYYGIRNEAFLSISPAKLVRAIVQLQGLAFVDAKMEVRTADFYLKNITETRSALGEKTFFKVKDFLLAGSKLVNQDSRFLTNGDLHPQNLMIKDRQFIILDWDLLEINNPAWDLVCPYLWGWRNRDWQERLLDEYRKITRVPLNDFEKIFSFDVVYLSSQLIKHAQLVKLPKEFLETQEKILMAHLSRQL